MTRDELRERLRRAVAGYDLAPLDWEAAMRRGHRALLARQVAIAASALALFAALVAGGLLARSALGGERHHAAKRTAKPIAPPRTMTTPRPVTPPPPTSTTPQPVPAHGPDLAAAVSPGELRVVNLGDRAAGPFRVTFEERTVLRSQGLAPGERSGPLKVPQDRPCPVPPAIIDPDDAVHESDESNNRVEVPCVPPPPTTTTTTTAPPIK